jgi:peptidoglycan hydrolase-like protein with peptidoglycan-binding domain
LDGRLLNVDGTLGRNSQHALAQFQRDHGLPATGHLNEATQQRLAVMERTMASNTHPANDLYRQSLSAVQALDRQMGIPGGAHTAALAGAAAAEAARAGLTGVDRVEISADRVHVQAVQFTGGVDQWATNRTSSPIDVAHAVRQPLEVSSRDAGRAMEARQSAEQHMAQERAPMRAPVL